MVESLANHSVGIILQNIHVSDLYTVYLTLDMMLHISCISTLGVKTQRYLLCKKGSLMPLIFRKS